MSPRVCHAMTFVAIVVVILAPACRASSPCSPPPQGCNTWNPDTPVQVPVEVDLCVVDEASEVLAIQDHDSNDVSSLTVRSVASGVMMETRKGHEVKDNQTVPEAALEGRRLHLKIQYNGQDLRVLTRDDAALLDIPVSGTDSLRVTLKHQHSSHNAMICSELTTSPPTTQRLPTLPPLRNASTTGPASDQTSDAPKEEEEEERKEKMVVLLGVGTGLVGVAVTLSLGMLGLTLAFP